MGVPQPLQSLLPERASVYAPHAVPHDAAADGGAGGVAESGVQHVLPLYGRDDGHDVGLPLPLLPAGGLIHVTAALGSTFDSVCPAAQYASLSHAQQSLSGLSGLYSRHAAKLQTVEGEGEGGAGGLTVALQY